ncbi:MAG: calcium-binding protein, partial [Planctomycetota bacterium]|nr:calcium-binding protein [Planctomycetota bacterium]
RGLGFLIFESDRYHHVADVAQGNNTYILPIQVDGLTGQPTSPEIFPNENGGGGFELGTPSGVDLNAQQVTAFINGLNGLAQWASDLSSFGALAIEMPLFLDRPNPGNPDFLAPLTLADIFPQVGTLSGLGAALEQGFVDAITNFLSGATPSSADIVMQLDALPGVSNVVGGLFNETGADVIRFDFDFSETVTRSNLELSFGTNATDAEIDFDTAFAANFDLSATIDWSLSFGFDLTQGLSPQDAFFIRSGDFTATASASANNLNFQGRVGFLGVEVNNGSLSFNAPVEIEIKNPDADAAGNITLAELQGTTLNALVNLSTAGASYNVNLPVTTDLFNVGAGVTVLVSGDPFSGLAPSVSTQGFDELDLFKNISSADFFGLFWQLHDMFNEISVGGPLLSTIPFTQNTRIGDVLNLGQSIADLILPALQDPVTLATTFETAQGFSDILAAIGEINPGLIVPQYDPATNEIVFTLRLDFSDTPVNAPLAFNFDLGPFGDIAASTQIALTAAGVLEIDFGFDLTERPMGVELADRFFTQNGSFTGGIALSASAINATAMFQIVEIAINNGSISGDLNVNFGLQNPTSMVAGARTTLAEIFDAIDSDPGDLVDGPNVTGSAMGAFNDISIDSNFFPISGSPSASFTMSNILDPGTFNPTFNADFNPLAAFEQLDGLSLGAAFGLLTDYLSAALSGPLFNTIIPGVNQSISDIIGFIEQFENFVDQVRDGITTLQSLANAIQDAFSQISGTTRANSTNVSFDPMTNVLGIQLNLDVTETLPLPFSLNLGDLGSQAGEGTLDELGSLIGGSGMLSVEAGVQALLDFGIDLSDALNPTPFLGDQSFVALILDVDTPVPLDFNASIGPFGIFINDATLDVSDGMGGPAALRLDLDDDAMDGRHTIGELIAMPSLFTLGFNGRLDANVPLEAPQGNSIGSIALKIGDLADIPGTIALTPSVGLDLEDIIGNINFEIGGIAGFVEGLDQLLMFLRDAFSGELGGFDIPVIGDGLGEASQFIEDFRQTVIVPLNMALMNGMMLAGEFEMVLEDALNGLFRGSSLSRGGPIDVSIASDLVTFEFTVGDSYTVSSGDIDFGLNLPALNFNIDGEVSLTFDWQIQFLLGISLTDGVFIGTAADPEIEVTVTAAIDNLMAGASLGFLALEATDNGSFLTGSFQIDLVDPMGANNRLTLDEILGGLSFSDVLDLNIPLEAFVDLDLALGFGIDGSVAPTLPSLLANFTVAWMWDASNPNDLTAPEVVFGDVMLDAGSFISDFLRPIFERINDVLDPISPALDLLLFEIPVIEQNILELLGLGGAVPFLEAVQTIADIAAAVAGSPPGNILIPLGGLDLGGYDFNTPFSARGFDINDYLMMPAQDPLQAIQSSGSLTAVGDAHGDAAAGGLSLGILDPAQALGLLLGQDAELIRYDLPVLQFNRTFELPPILIATLFGIPINLKFAIGLGAEFVFGFGYDSSGFRKFFGDDPFFAGNPLAILDGFFLADTRNGIDIPELRFTAYFQGEVAIGTTLGGFFGIEVGGGGRISGTILLNLRDPNDDGRVNGSELAMLFAQGPLCVFEGEIRLDLDIYVFAKECALFVCARQEFSIVSPNLFRYEFGGQMCLVPPPMLATQNIGGAVDTNEADGVVYLNMGPRAAERVSGDITDGDEIFIVQRLDENNIIVSAFGLQQIYGPMSDVGPGVPVTKIIAEGGMGNDQITIGETITLPTELFGDFRNGGPNPGNDIIQGGSGEDFIDGGPGNDQLKGNDGNDTIRGGDGDDSIGGGRGNDLLFGGDGIDLIEGFDGDDRIAGGRGDDSLFGQKGNDVIRGGDGNDFITGDEGQDTLFGDGANDGSGTTSRGLDSGDDGTVGNDVIFGNADSDTIVGGLGDDLIFGDSEDINAPGGAADLIYGDTTNNPNESGGVDNIFGGAGDDQIFGGPNNDMLFGQAGNDIIFGEMEFPGSIGFGVGMGDFILGGAGDDLLYGSPRNDQIFGEDDADRAYGGAGDDQIIGGTGPDQLYGGTGADVIIGQQGNDYIEGNEGNDTIQGDQGSDLIYAGSGDDVVLGGESVDEIHGEAGNDQIFGNTGGDLILGYLGDDILSGNEGDDVIRGGAGNDIILGLQDNDLLYGDDGVDHFAGGMGE